MKKHRLLVPAMVLAVAASVLLFPGAVRAASNGTGTDSAASVQSVSVQNSEKEAGNAQNVLQLSAGAVAAVPTERYSAALPAAKSEATAIQTAVKEQRIGGIGFFLVLLSGILSGMAVVSRGRRGKLKSSPIDLGSKHGRANGPLI